MYKLARYNSVQLDTAKKTVFVKDSMVLTLVLTQYNQITKVYIYKHYSTVQYSTVQVFTALWWGKCVLSRKNVY